ncbi:MAG: hypothetical protein A2170_09810 [Deltaproteobacteria bacterium RBG_13_53_10]|nr:MAG: hypothetical protein A2170_09810 [Deltaproteobacteria bacterium RBG_13_53_10]
MAPVAACSFLTFQKGVSLTGEANGSWSANRSLQGKELIQPSGKGFASETLRVISLAPEPTPSGR